MDLKLGIRLAAIAAFVPPGMSMADIGTDHGYLPIVLMQDGIITRAVAGDVHDGPYASAVAAVGQSGFANAITVRKGDGLGVLTPGEVEVVVIAGMGGSNMIKILTDYPEITARLSKLILQPMIGAASLRRWLVQNGWCITAECLVEEDDILYQIIGAEPGEVALKEPILEEIGPILWEQRHPLLAMHLEELIGQIDRVLTGMSISEEARQTPKYRELQVKKSQLEDKRRCL